MTNERLRSAIYSAGLTLDQVSDQIEVDPKTIERWISKGRLPHRANRERLARALDVDQADIWPGLATSPHDIMRDANQVVSTYSSRSSISSEFWECLINRAQRHIDILAFAGSFLHDALPNFVEHLEARASDKVRVRLLFGNPDATAVAIRGQEEGIGDSLRDRCQLTWKYLRPLQQVDGVQMRMHECTLYQSLFIFDDELLVNQHTYGLPASRSPVVHIRSLQSPLGVTYSSAFEAVWSRSKDVSWPGS